MFDQLPALLRWDIFCRVIDNFGDAGVCWRLAADLASRGETVRLYIDQPEILAGLTGRSPGDYGVSVHPWPQPEQKFSANDIADVVIEAFACDPPAAYIQAMNDAQRPIAWINLEYLSAEDWVQTHHRLTSPHPRFKLTKHFYFPGFTPETGGLLREPGMLATQPDQTTLSLGSPDTTRIFLFSYEQPVISGWLDALAATGHTTLGIAPCPALSQIDDWLMAGSSQSTLIIERLPFVRQQEFDTMIATYDWLFIRGEDSFVRAQWAAKPLVWHIYPQDEGAHLTKLQAFYDRYLDQGVLSPEQRDTYWQFVRLWNGSAPAHSRESIARLWEELMAIYPALLQNAHVWREALLKQPDLVTQLGDFARHLVKSQV